jgi:hypothetical protein
LGLGLADNHLHLIVLGAERPSALATECGRAISRLQLGARCEPARVTTIEHLAHLANTLRYVHRQDLKHGVDQDPRREGTSLPDLLGLRVVAPWLVPRVRLTLPRLRGRDLLTELGVETLDERVVPGLLADAAAAALALPVLEGRATRVLLARRALRARRNRGLSAGKVAARSSAVRAASPRPAHPATAVAARPRAVHPPPPLLLPYSPQSSGQLHTFSPSPHVPSSHAMQIFAGFKSFSWQTPSASGALVVLAAVRPSQHGPSSITFTS